MAQNSAQEQSVELFLTPLNLPVFSGLPGLPFIQSAFMLFFLSISDVCCERSLVLCIVRGGLRRISFPVIHLFLVCFGFDVFLSFHSSLSFSPSLPRKNLLQPRA